MRGLGIDIHRQFSRRIFSAASLRREWFTDTVWCQPFPETSRLFSLFGMPVVVAALFTLAFLASDTSPEADKFIFFATLYAFWLGLFGSCQILNGSVASGEWSYWVLGHRFPLGQHLFANLVVSFVAVSLQVGSFLFSIVAFDHFLSHGKLMPVLKAGSFNVQQPGDFGIMTFFEAQAFTTITLGLALFAAAVSGACLGAMLSACFKETASSMRAAVVLMVIQSVISSTVLIESGVGSRFPLIVVWWNLPQKSAFAEDLRSPGSTLKLLGRHRGDRLLEDISFLLPQRYFYNIAAILTTKVCVVDLGRPSSAPEKALNTAFKKDPILWPKITQWSDPRPENLRWTEGRLIPVVYPGSGEFLPFASFIYRHLILPELTALFVLGLFHVTITYYIIRKRECFHILR